MIKQAIEYIAGLAVRATQPQTTEIGEHVYATQNLVQVDRPDLAEPIVATTLSSLIRYVVEQRRELSGQTIIQIKSPTEVQVYSGLRWDQKREYFFTAKAQTPSFRYGDDYSQESFIIALQACFADGKDDDREAVAVFASNIVSQQKETYSDNGVTQQAVIKTGITTKGAALVPNPVRLTPYRTFAEISQPVSDFVFRVGEGRGGEPAFKLVEADGGAWRNKAMDNIRAYLETALRDIPDCDNITIIS
jgi:hypothetical protein